MTKNQNKPGMFFSAILQNIYVCLESGPSTVGDIISKSCRNDFSFSRPRKDVIRGLKILSIMGMVKKSVRKEEIYFEISESPPEYADETCRLSMGVGMLLDELRESGAEISGENIRSALKDFSDEEFGKIIEMFIRKKEIRSENGKLFRNVKVFTHKKTSD